MESAAIRHVPRDLNVMSLLSFQGCGIIDGQHFLVAVRNQNGFLAAGDALLGALGMRGIGALGATFRIADPSAHGLVRGRKRSDGKA